MPDTRTGTQYQQMIQLALEHSGLVYKAQQNVGVKPDGGNHRVDFVAWRPSAPERKILVSCKVQTQQGTAEEKLPYEVIKLVHVMRLQPQYVSAYLILGGEGWSKGIRQFCKSGLCSFIAGADKVVVYTTDELLSSGFSF